MKKSSFVGIVITWVVALVVGIISLTIDWMPTQAGGFSKDVDWLFYFIYGVNVFFFLLIGGLMFTFAIRGRQHVDERDEIVKGATHNTVVEVAWTVPPLVIVLAIFVWGFRGYLDMSTMPPPSADAYLVDVEAYQWAWQFTHENGAIVSGANHNAVLDIPADRPVEFRLSARDVLHSLYLPAQRAKKDCVPGRYNRMWVEVPVSAIEEQHAAKRAAGEEFDERYADYPLHCTEYCGQQHAQMNGILRVWKPQYWEEQLDVLNIWNKENATPVDWGQFVHSQFGGCASCHSVDGTEGTGPSWKNLWNQQRNGKKVDEQYILESIYKPSVYYTPGYEGVAMSSYAGSLNYGDVIGVIEYIKQLSDVPAEQMRPAYPEDRAVYDGKTWLDLENKVVEAPPLD